MRPQPLIVPAALVALLLPSPASAATNVQIAGLQVALRAQGLYPGPIDAVAGPMTLRAVTTFQRRHGLTADGIAGPRTRTALGRLGRPYFGRRMLRRPMVGWDVGVLQFLLARRGIRTGVIDGHYGRETFQAVRRYQRRAGLARDGIAGPATIRALRAGRTKAPRRPRLRSASTASVRVALGYWAARYRVEASLVRALAWMESGNQSHVTSPAGAWGVMQVTPATWRYVETVLLGDRVPHTANGNVRVGVAYLNQLLHEFRFDTRRALGAYNQGPASVRRHGLFPETRHFVRAVLALRRRSLRA